MYCNLLRIHEMINAHAKTCYDPVFSNPTLHLHLSLPADKVNKRPDISHLMTHINP